MEKPIQPTEQPVEVAPNLTMFEVLSTGALLLFLVLYLPDYIFDASLRGTFKFGYFYEGYESEFIWIFLAVNCAMIAGKSVYGYGLKRFPVYVTAAVIAFLVSLQSTAVRERAVIFWVRVVERDVPIHCVERSSCVLSPGVVDALLGREENRARVREQLGTLIETGWISNELTRYALARAEGSSAMDFALKDAQSLRDVIATIEHEYGSGRGSELAVPSSVHAEEAGDASYRFISETDAKAVLTALMDPERLAMRSVSELVDLRIALTGEKLENHFESEDREVVRQIRSIYQNLSGSPTRDYVSELARMAAKVSSSDGKVGLKVVVNSEEEYDAPGLNALAIRGYLANRLALLGYDAVDGDDLVWMGSLDSIHVLDEISYSEVRHGNEWVYEKRLTSEPVEAVLKKTEQTIHHEEVVLMRIPVFLVLLRADGAEKSFRLEPTLPASAKRVEWDEKKQFVFDRYIDTLSGEQCAQYDVPCLDERARDAFGLGSGLSAISIDKLPAFGVGRE